jgi:hypothetical protein
MPRRIWRARRRSTAELTDSLVCFLVTGCCGLGCPSQFPFDRRLYDLHAEVAAGRLERLRALWATYGETLTAGYPDRPMFAKLVLDGAPVHAAVWRANEDTQGEHTTMTTTVQRAASPTPNGPGGPSPGTPPFDPRTPAPRPPREAPPDREPRR